MGWLLVIAVAVIVIAALLQAAIPIFAARRITRRLTAHGGEISVEIRAWPASKLLRRCGDRLRVEGRGIEIGISERGGGLAALDGFDEVEIELLDFFSGPFEIASFRLTRSGSGPYVVQTEASTSGAELLDFGGSHLGIGAAPLLGRIARQAPLGTRPFPVSAEVELVSDGGVLRVSSGEGTVAGYPAGRIASALAAAVAGRLELSF